MLSPCPFSSQHLLSSTHHLMFPLRLSRIREVKMIPRSMWRQRADSSSTRDKEKESKRWALGKIEERNKDQHLSLVPARCAEETSREECSLHNHPSGRSLRWRTREAATSAWRTNKELQHHPVQDQSCGKSTRSTISKTRFAFLNSTLSGFYFAIFVMFICRLLFACFWCEYMLETLRTMFDLSVGGN